MPGPSASKRVSKRARAAALLLAAACAALTVTGTAQAATPLAFETIFTAQGEPPALHYKASFAGADGQQHTLQVWRDGQTRLRRSTDDRVDAYVLRAAPDADAYQMTVVDYARRITTRINRDNLLRLGNASDWFDLAHGLRRPAGPYQLSASQRPAQAPAPIAACRWYALREGASAHRICWSESDRLPLVIWSEQKGAAVWRVTEVARQPIAGDVFRPRDEGFVRNDADEDIDKD